MRSISRDIGRAPAIPNNKPWTGLTLTATRSAAETRRLHQGRSRHSQPRLALTPAGTARLEEADPLKKPTSAAACPVGLAGGQFRYVTKYARVAISLRSASLLQAGAATVAWRGARPFEGRPGASRLFGDRCRTVWPRVGFTPIRSATPSPL